MAQNCRAVGHRMFLFVSGKGVMIFYHLRDIIDAPDALGNYNVNCCHTDVSLSDRLLIL